MAVSYSIRPEARWCVFRAEDNGTSGSVREVATCQTEADAESLVEAMERFDALEVEKRREAIGRHVARSQELGLP
jgi:hypothetical protein